MQLSLMHELRQRGATMFLPPFTLRYIGMLLAILVLSTAHISPILASSFHSPADHGSHESVPCQDTCQLASKQQEKTIDSEENDKDDDKMPPAPFFAEVELIHSGVGLLRTNSVWMRSSWVPPDILLQSGAYSSSL